MNINRATRDYTDLDLNFNKHPVTRDIARVTGIVAIKRSVRNLVLTNFYERPFQPKLGSGVAYLLFEPVDQIVAYEIKSAIENVINNYEPRVNLTEVHVIPRPEQNSFECTIHFFPANSSNPETIDIFLKRLR